MTSAFNTTVILALFAVMALRPPIPRRPSPFSLQFALGWWINEVPLIGVWWLLAGTIGTLIEPRPGVWWSLIFVLTVVDMVMLVRLALLSAAFHRAFGPCGPQVVTRPVWWYMLLPILARRPGVRRVSGLKYGRARRGNRLDVYVSRRDPAAPASAPVLVYFHAAFGSKSLGSRPVFYDLASRGWVCISAGRRQFRAGYHEQLADTRAALAWARENAATYGGDRRRIIAAGGSAGANLAATAAMTGRDIAAVIGLYGYYGAMGAGPEPASVAGPDAPPMLIVHGTLDTLVPCREARAFADRIRTVSNQPVVHAELPGAGHSFDVFRSIRLHAVTDAIAQFAELTRHDGTGIP